MVIAEPIAGSDGQIRPRFRGCCRKVLPSCSKAPSVTPSHRQMPRGVQPTPRHHSALADDHQERTLIDTLGSFPDRLYCFGGSDKTSIFNDLWVLENPSSSSRSWRELPTGPPHRVWFGFAEGAGKLFVVNGMADSSKFEIL